MKKHRFLFVIVSLLLLILATTLPISAEIVSGSCGPDCTWTFNNENGELRISGKGEMTDYTSAPETPWASYWDNIKTLVIDEGITKIGNYCFGGLQEIRTVTFPSSVKEIGNNAFQNCWKIEKLVLPNTVERVGSSAFSHCSNITEVSLSKALTVLEISVFEHCSSLRSISIPNSVKRIKTKAFEHCVLLSEIDFGTGVEQIDEYCFQYCNSLKEIVIPDQVTILRNHAFYMCTDLKTATLGSGLETISSNLFTRSGLEKVIISEGTQTIDTQAFSGCYSLYHITLPKSLKIIKEGAFVNDVKIGSICYLGCKEQWETITIEKNNEHLTRQPVTAVPHEMTEFTPYDETSHQSSCVCGETEYESHEFGEALPYDKTQHVSTCKCGEKRYEKHTYSNGACSTCGEKKTTGCGASITTKGILLVCLIPIGMMIPLKKKSKSS